MRIGAGFGAGLRSRMRAGTPARRPAPARDFALVPVAPAAPEPGRLSPLARPDPAILAQLFAVAEDERQGRRRRRVKPGEAASAYGAPPAAPAPPQRQLLA
jgi:hypothetical protein